MKKFLCVLLCCFVFIPSHGMKQMILQTRKLLFKVLCVQKRFAKNDKKKLFLENSTLLYGSTLKFDNEDPYLVDLCKGLGCGICKKTGSEVTWYSNHSFGVHQDCFDAIKKSEEQAYKKILKLLNPETASKNDIVKAHIHFIDIVEKVIEEFSSEKLTIFEYRAKFGEKSLKKVFSKAFNGYKKYFDFKESIKEFDKLFDGPF